MIAMLFGWAFKAKAREAYAEAWRAHHEALQREDTQRQYRTRPRLQEALHERLRLRA